MIRTHAADGCRLLYVGMLAIVGMPPFSLFQSEFLMVARPSEAVTPPPVVLFILFGAGVFAGIVLHVNRLVLGGAGEGRGSWNPWCDSAVLASAVDPGGDGLLAARTLARIDSRRGARGDGGLMSDLFEELCEKFPSLPSGDR